MHTFVNFIVASNFVAGAVIFLILLIVQFVVITKGATLDAMAGKRMSIDADVCVGAIDNETAKIKRNELGRENQPL
jgi:flagellar biosynthesis component FlhA